MGLMRFGSSAVDIESIVAMNDEASDPRDVDDPAVAVLLRGVTETVRLRGEDARAARKFIGDLPDHVYLVPASIPHARTFPVPPADPDDPGAAGGNG